MTRLRVLLYAAVFAVVALPAAGAPKGAPKGVLPTIDLQKRCRTSASTVVEMMGDKTQHDSAFDTCMKSEQEARDAILKAWSDMPQYYKSFCIRPADYSPSYVEWIACIEMLIDVKKLRESANTPAKR